MSSDTILKVEVRRSPSGPIGFVKKLIGGILGKYL